MTRKWLVTVAIAFVVSLVPAAVSAQAYLFLGGGGTFPTNNFGNFAKNGWLVSGGAGFPLGQEGVSVAVEGFYGENTHEGAAGGKTNPYGAMGEIVYAFGPRGKIQPYLLGGAGIMVHKFTPSGGGASTSESQVGYTFGAGVTIPLGQTLGISGAGRYYGSKDTVFLGVLVGLVFFLGD
jgi:hypothetical protein